MPTYSTPGVYVEEISTLPPSVAGVSTAIPAFIGYTEIGPTPAAGGAVEPVVARITTMLEYRALFGGAAPSSFTATTRPGNGTAAGELSALTRDAPANEFLLYYSLSLYFQNGGGSCYVVSVGNYGVAPLAAHITAGLAALEKEDEPTLIMLTDAVSLFSSTDYYQLCTQALAQCQKLGDRFAILDVKPDANPITTFRTGIGINNLAYGAAYYPYLLSTIPYDYAETGVNVQLGAAPAGSWRKALGPRTTGISVSYTGTAAGTPQVVVVAEANAPTTLVVSASNILTITADPGTTGSELVAAWQGTVDKQGFELAPTATSASTTVDKLATASTELDALPTVASTATLESLRSTNTALYNQVKAALAQQRVTLPPSAAIAGVYASVDRDRGVWKAPANVSLAGVLGPVSKITNQDQDLLNVDPTAGKSINAIRAFTGKGTLVWGARTLAGNDNEWRYVPVRRLFIMIEESVQKASAFAVFEPNDATTWLKVKAMIESYLYGLWEQGAMAGPTPEAAYFVNVGLGKTMTPDDILRGRMIVEIGIAAVRPAEFILLRFTHKLQEA